MTENNSNEMKTVVETFLVEETIDLIYDNEKLDKWNGLVAELGLSGQKKIVQPNKSPIPFMHIKKSMLNVFECLCPREVCVEDYDITPIPVEILDLISLSKKENYFTRIMIRYDEKQPDPVCVGMLSEYYVYNYEGVPKEVVGKRFKTRELALRAIKEIKSEFNGNNSFGWEDNKVYYLIGKWADVKHSFNELKEMATHRYIGEKGNEYKKQIKEAERGLADLEAEAFDKFN